MITPPLPCAGWRARLAALALAAAALAACDDAGSAAGASEPPPRPVVTMAVEPRALAQRRVVAGVVRARDRADLSFRVAGQVAEVAVEIGDAVRRGDVIARLDPAALDLRALQAEAAVARLEALGAEKRRAAETQRELLDRAVAARRTVETVEAELAAVEAELAEARAGLALAHRDQTDATLRAPFDGRIAAREVEPNAEVAPGQVIVRLDGEALEAAANLPASILAAVEPGAPAAVEVLGARLDGRIAAVGPRAETGLTFPAVIALGPEAEAFVRPGMVAEISVDLGAASALVVPLAALVPEGDDGGASVFVLAEGGDRVARRGVSVARLTDAGAVVAAGIAPGDRIVAAGAAFLSDGQTVRPLD